ncbi:MAG: flagellar biosynthesis protein FlgB [Planctomycetes bacterium]|nr:flagellar biosynthesis protein FlgB [Planctomycetota bacterium]
MQAKPVDLLVHLLGACETRARVVSANIANSNTPGYVRQVVRFEELLSQELDNGGDVTGVVPEVAADLEAPARPDGNSVSLELELNAMRENRLLYEAYSSILRSHFALLESAITAGR